MNSRFIARVIPDVGEAPLLLHLVRFGERTIVREDALLDADDEHDGELEPLGRVEGHQHDLIVVVEIVGVGDQRHLLEELVEHGELACRTDQLAEVLDPTVRLDGVLGLELAEIARVVDRGLEQVARPDVVAADHGVETVEQLDERRDAPSCRAADAGLLSVRRNASTNGTPSAAAYSSSWADARVADAALGHVEDPLDAHLVERVDDGTQVRHRVLDLAPVVEAGAADHLVRARRGA